jgi:hypothetical protein
MFGLFRSKKVRLKKQAEKTFDTYIMILQGMSPTEIAYVLEGAARLKWDGPEADPQIYRDPLISMSEGLAIEFLVRLNESMNKLRGSLQGEASVGQIMVWWLSIAATHFPEFRVKGRAMWKELHRGFPHCMRFDPEIDTVVGLEPFN